jgi:NAD(P)-dependent dehydrogenase (short-subunit alcohol dehydrogenase family)
MPSRIEPETPDQSRSRRWARLRSSFSALSASSSSQACRTPAKPRRRLIEKAARHWPSRSTSPSGSRLKRWPNVRLHFGHIEFLFNSAGAAIRRAKFLEIDDTLMEKTFALNVNGTLHSMQALLPHMLANRHGVIVNMASMAHRRGGPGSSIHYAAAKGAVVSMTLGVAREFATQGIRALSISPGPIKTPFQGAAQSSPELIKQFLDDVPMQRFGEPEEIGELVLFICSDACEFMTADTVYVSGGGGWR